MRKKYLLILVVLLTLTTRGFALSYPPQVVFDEVHFGKFITAYCCTGEHFFDIHPPHAKLLIAGAAYLAGYRGGFTFDTIGQSYPAGFPLVALRIVPALAGALLPLVLLALTRQLGGSPAAGLLVAWLAVFDNALTVQSRLISLDSILLLATFGSLSLFLAGAKLQERFKSTHWIAIVLAGAAAGLAVGTKFTGLAALGLLGLLVLVKILHPKRSAALRTQWAGIGMVLLLSAAVVYGMGWAIHWSTLPLPGPGDAFHKPDFSGWSVEALIRETFIEHQVMLAANYNLTAEHPYASQWWQWPWLIRPVFYWQSGGALIYFLGNPLVWWGSTLLALFALLMSVIRFGQVPKKSPRLVAGLQLPAPRLWIPLVGYGIALAPFVRIPRALFLYHYLTPLLFSLLFGVLWLDTTFKSTRSRLQVFGGIAVAALLLFIWFMPLTYGIPIRLSLQSLFFWFPTWR